MNLISAGSISLDNTFKVGHEVDTAFKIYGVAPACLKIYQDFPPGHSTGKNLADEKSTYWALILF
jgi:hypothetical protein